MPSNISSFLLAQSPRIGVASEYLFRATDNEVLNWQVQSAGETVASGSLALNLAPQGREDFTLCDGLTLPAGAREVWLTLEVVQPQATAWSDAGTAWPGRSSPLPPAGLTRPAAVGPAPELTIDDESFTVRQGSSNGLSIVRAAC